MRKNFYPAQAVVIAMIVIIVSAIIGLGIAFRNTRDTTGTLDDQTSSDALSIASSVTDVLSLTENDKLFTDVEKCGTSAERDVTNISSGISCVPWTDTDGTQYMTLKIGDEDTGLEAVEEYLKAHGIKVVSGGGSDGSSIDLSGLFENCGGQTGSSSKNNVYMTLTKTNDNTMEIPESTTIGYSVQGQNVSDSSCSLQLSFRQVLDNNPIGVIVQKIYSRKLGNGLYEYKNYEPSDTEEYCIGSCPGDKFVSGWGKLDFSSTSSRAILNNGIPLKETKGDYTLDEIRVTTVGGKVYLTSTLSNPGCAGSLDLATLRIETVATCNGTSRGQEVKLTRNNNDSYPTTFDYAIYNAQGTLELFDATK